MLSDKTPKPSSPPPALLPSSSLGLRSSSPTRLTPHIIHPATPHPPSSPPPTPSSQGHWLARKFTNIERQIAVLMKQRNSANSIQALGSDLDTLVSLFGASNRDITATREAQIQILSQLTHMSTQQPAPKPQRLRLNTTARLSFAAAILLTTGTLTMHLSAAKVIQAYITLPAYASIIAILGVTVLTLFCLAFYKQTQSMYNAIQAHVTATQSITLTKNTQADAFVPADSFYSGSSPAATPGPSTPEHHTDAPII